MIFLNRFPIHRSLACQFIFNSLQDLRFRIHCLFYFLPMGLIQLNAQNLIPNPGFEQCDLCDGRGFKELGIGSGANNPIDWNAATYGSPDFYSIAPHTGKKHGGFFVGFAKHEYLTNHFTNPLKAGAVYQFSFWTRPSTQNANYAIDEMGVFIQTGPAEYKQAEPLKQIKPTYESPDQDYLKGPDYKLLSFNYTACGGEDHFIVGRFRALTKGDTSFIGTKPPSNPGGEAIYYFVDDFEMIEITPPQMVDLLPKEILLCPGEIKKIRIPSPYDQGIIKWSTGENQAEIQVPETSSLTVEIQLQDNCKTILRDTVLIRTEPEINIKILGPDKVCIGDTIEIEAVCNGNCFDFSWSNGFNTRNIMIRDTGVYIVKAKTTCKELSASFHVDALKKEINTFIKFPNVLAANGEEINRKFKPSILKHEVNRVLEMKMMIYNRWGQKLFETSDLNGAWFPAEGVPMDTYIYLAEFKYQDCDRIRSSKLSGSISLIR